MAKIERNDYLQKVKFGKTDMMVTEVCAGTMTFGSFVGVESVAHEQLDALIALGVNFFDTAEMYPVAFNYGRTTEQWIGNWLGKHLKDGMIERDMIYIASKCNPTNIGAPDLPGREKPWGFDAESIMASCKASLERLQTTYIDLYYLHWPSRDVPVFGSCSFHAEGKNRGVPFFDHGEPEVFEAQVLAVKALLDAGLIKYWGLANENSYGVTMFCMTCDKLGVPRPVCVQNDYSLVNRTYEDSCLEACHRFGLVGCHYGNMAGGVLSGKYHKGALGEAYSMRDGGVDKARMKSTPDFQPRYGFPMVMKAAEKYAAVADKLGITPSEFAYAWSRQRPFVAAVIIGVTSVRQATENVNAFKIKDFPPEILAEVDAIHEENRNPTQYHCEKQLIMDAPWLGADPYRATDATDATVAK